MMKLANHHDSLLVTGPAGEVVCHNSQSNSQPRSGGIRKKDLCIMFHRRTSTEHTWPTRGKSRRIVVAVGWLRGLTVVYRWPLKSQKSEQAWNSTKNTPVTRWCPRSYSSVYNPQWHYRYTDIYSNPHSSTLVFSPMVPLSAYSGIFRDNQMMASAHCAAHRSSPLSNEKPWFEPSTIGRS